MSNRSGRNETGFSLIELSIAMGFTLVVMGVATALSVGVFRVRTRENQRSEALADVQRAVNIMSRDIANSGFGLNDNGLVAGDCSDNEIRVRANLNAFDATASYANRSQTIDPDEDIVYVETNNNIVRRDMQVGGTSGTNVLSYKLDAMKFHYFTKRVVYSSDGTDCDITVTNFNGGSELTTNYTDKSQVRYLVIVVCVTLPAVGTPGGSNYQPPSQVKLVSDVELRNGLELSNY
jgi:Tfp pilus assembly protein PilW